MSIALLFYKRGCQKCRKAMVQLEWYQDVIVQYIDVYDPNNLELVNEWNICCTPTLIFLPSGNRYTDEQIQRKNFEKDI